MSIHNQTTFIGGLDMLAPDVEISNNAYRYLINGRQRLGGIKPVNKPILLDEVPAGKKQGAITVGTTTIMFVAGSAYFNVDGEDTWIRIGGFSMSTTADTLWAIAVPAGSANYVRKLNATGNITGELVKTYNNDFTISGTPQAILVQDGINQPKVIIRQENGWYAARATYTFAQWDFDGIREYVPIGKQMFIVDAKLFIVAVDGKSIYHSVSGRYLDFMVNVDKDGKKLATENLGGADSTSFSFGADTITCAVASTVASSFVYATSKNTKIITLDYTRLIFGEPTYYVAVDLIVGAVNQYSIVDILGDTAVIDYEGVKSFNAVQQIQSEGRNSIFSLQLAKLLNNKIQYRPCCIKYNNYAIFNLDTMYGNVFTVYDMLLEKWVAIDILSSIGGSVKQFYVVETTAETKLYVITATNEVYHLYPLSAANGQEPCQLYTKSFTALDDAGNPVVAFTQKGEHLHLYFQGGTETASVYTVELVDGKQSLATRLPLTPNVAGLKFPLEFPIVFSTEQTSAPTTFNLRGGLKGNKAAYIITWSNDAELIALQLKTQDEVPVMNSKQKEETYASRFNR